MRPGRGRTAGTDRNIVLSGGDSHRSSQESHADLRVRSQGTLRILEDPCTASSRKGACRISNVEGFECIGHQTVVCSFFLCDGTVVLQIGYLGMLVDNEQHVSGAITVRL